MNFRALILLIAFALSACASMAMKKPEAGVDQSSQLKAAVDQVIRENKEACQREEYKPFYLKSACKVADITPVQLADTSKISPAEMPLFLKFRSESQARMGKAAAAYRSYGGAHGVEEALALERTGSLAEKNTQNLYDGTITWGDYSKRRKEIEQFFFSEFDRINESK